MGKREQLNKLGKVTLCKTSDKPSSWFTGWLKSPVSVSAENDFVDIVGQMSNLGVMLLANAGGIVPAFDMPRKFAYRGAGYSDLQLDVMLRIDDQKEVMDSFHKPILALCKYALPTRSSNSLMKEIDNLAAKDGLAGMIGSGVDALRGFISMFTKSVDNILKETYLMNLPEQIESKEELYCYIGGEGTKQKSRIRLGPFIIKSLSITLGKLIMSGGYPETIDIKIGLSALRATTYQTFASIFQDIPPQETVSATEKA